MAKLTLKCEYCGKECYKYPSQVKNNVFCSKECGNLFRRTIPESICEVCGKTFRRHSTSNAGRYCSKECEGNKKVFKECENCGKEFHAKFIRNNPSKYCSVSCYNEVRKAEEQGRTGMYHWKRAVYKRCDYTCQNCGSKEDLCAHHIYSYKHYENLRTDENNGIVYCKECHKLIHKKHGYHSQNKMIF